MPLSFVGRHLKESQFAINFAAYLDATSGGLVSSRCLVSICHFIFSFYVGLTNRRMNNRILPLALCLLAVLAKSAEDGLEKSPPDNQKRIYHQADKTYSDFIWRASDNNGNNRSAFPPRLRSQFIPETLLSFDNKYPRSAPSEELAQPHMSIANMTCKFFRQPLDHFVPRGKSPYYEQRYCVYNGYSKVENSSSDGSTQTQRTPDAPIFFYTGNESPLEQYINHTGLMWELAPLLGARVVFAEHRYEGRSLPPSNLTTGCLSYASTTQALADYANLLQREINPHNQAPVIAFGGSYGGMLSAWIRMKYPHLVAGSIAASAPLGGIPSPSGKDVGIDGSTRVLRYGLQQRYPPASYRHEIFNEETNEKELVDDENHCSSNLLAAWPLVSWLVEQGGQGEFLQEAFALCEPYEETDPSTLLEFGQTIWFDLAEGSFPYPSSYIPFALLHKKVDLPAWPLQAACWNYGRLHEDLGVELEGDPGAVRYTITYGNSEQEAGTTIEKNKYETELVLSVDWGYVTAVGNTSDFSRDYIPNGSVRELLTAVRDSLGIWYNITKDVQCYNVSKAAPNLDSGANRIDSEATHVTERNLRQPDSTKTLHRTDSARVCLDEIRRVGSWPPLCCNDEINMVNTLAHGLGQDFFWPPSVPRGVKTYRQMMENITMGPCADPDGVFGYSTENFDPWSTRLNTWYGNPDRIGEFSNIVFSNGLLDPWAAGGVYDKFPYDTPKYDGPMIQNISSNDVVALIIEYGGHHTDLMYSHRLDPECVSKAREYEKYYISKWIAEWDLGQCKVKEHKSKDIAT